MKNIYICYNYFTLYKAFVDIEKNNTDYIIFYRETVNQLPDSLMEKYNIKKIKRSKVKSTTLKNIKVLIEMIYFLRHEISEDDTKLIVFKDNNLIESTLIKYFSDLRIKKKQIILIEEGLGLYNTGSKYKNYRNKLLDICEYQGENKLVNVVVCSNPKLFMEKKETSHLTVLEEGNIFFDEAAESFIKEVLHLDMSVVKQHQEYDIVFLSQPINEIGVSLKAYKEMIEILALKSKVLIKKHPRDILDYSFLSRNENVQILDDAMSIIPFQILFHIIKTRCIITYYSSSYVDIVKYNSDINVILLYRLLENKYINALMVDLVKNNSNISIPLNIDELTKVVSGG